MYIKIKLSDNSIEGYPVDIPDFLQGLQQESLYDLSWTDPALKFSTIGLYPINFVAPSFDLTTDVLDGTYTYSLSEDKLSVIATANTREMTSEEKNAYDDQIAQQKQVDITNAITSKLQSLNTFYNETIDAGVVFQSKNFQLDQQSRANIDAGSLLATIAMLNNNGKTGDFRWANPNVDFGWIATDNTVLNMDAPTMVKFGQLSAGYYTELVFTARAIKDAIAALTSIDSVNAFDVTKGWPSSIVN